MSVRGLERMLLRGCLASGIAVAALAASGCGPLGALRATASDTWTHRYPLSATGEVVLVNVNGRVEVEGVDGSTLEIRAERIARGATGQIARDLLPRIPIDEHVAPDKVSVETGRVGGILIGASYEVRYHVRAPRTATIRATTVNGVVSLASLDGRVTARTVNGLVQGRNLRGGVQAETANGAVNIELAAVGPDQIVLRTTNGGVRLAVPQAARASIAASCINGRIAVSGLKVDVVAQSRRRFEGTLNGGGTSIDIRTTNGGIVIGAGFGDVE